MMVIWKTIRLCIQIDWSKPRKTEQPWALYHIRRVLPLAFGKHIRLPQAFLAIPPCRNTARDVVLHIYKLGAAFYFDMCFPSVILKRSQKQKKMPPSKRLPSSSLIMAHWLSLLLAKSTAFNCWIDSGQKYMAWHSQDYTYSSGWFSGKASS